MSAATLLPRDRREPAPARYHIVHETIYSYESPVSLSRQLLHLTPRDCAWQRCLAHQITVDPTVTAVRERLDCFGNPVMELAIEFPSRQPFRSRREHDRRLAAFAG
jgi:transglutaminase-like putative cysteine protease